MIRIDGVVAQRGGFRLGPVDLALERGGYLTILGPSGAGKTVLLEVVLGLSPAAQGRIVLDGVDATALPPEERRIAYLPQDLALFPHLSVRENILFGAGATNCGGHDEIAGRLRELTGLLDLAAILERKGVGSLSGGERQRVALARALMTGPRLLFLDEPFSALDAAIKRQLQIKLRQINRELGVTILHVTHDQEEAFLLGERIAVMIAGRLRQVGGRDDIYYRPASLGVARFLRNQNIFEARIERIDPDGSARLAAPLPLLCRPPAGGAAGDRVAVGIRSEEVVIIRPDRPIGPELQVNLLDGRVVDILGFGGVHTLTVEVAGVALNVEIPNCAFRDLGCRIGEALQIALRPRSLWTLPFPPPPSEDDDAHLR